MHVCAALLDRHGNVLKVGHHLASPSNIDSDDSGTFDVSMLSDDDATKFELWVDALVHNPNDVTAPVVVGPTTSQVWRQHQRSGHAYGPTATPTPRSRQYARP